MNLQILRQHYASNTLRLDVRDADADVAISDVPVDLASAPEDVQKAIATIEPWLLAQAESYIGAQAESVASKAVEAADLDRQITAKRAELAALEEATPTLSEARKA